MKDDRRLKRKVRNSYIVSTVSMALVLFLLGSVGYLIATAMSVAATLQESVTVTVELRNDADSTARASVATALAKEELAREVLFLSKDEKAADGDFRKMFECEFEEILEENPLLDSYEVRLTARGEERAEVDAFIRRIGRLEGVDRVSYPERMADRLHATVGKIRFVLLLFGGALLVVSLILLANTIRLAIYSKRYLINTMKLVGATKWYVMRPFLASSLVQGLWAGVMAAALFGASVWGLGEAVPEFAAHSDALIFAGSIVCGMIVCGEVLSLLFTFAAVDKFVNMKSNKIYLY